MTQSARSNTVREQFVVCNAVGFSDPYYPWPNTLADAQRFADAHSVNAATGERVTPLIKRRLISDWEIVPDETSPMDRLVESLPEQR